MSGSGHSMYVTNDNNLYVAGNNSNNELGENFESNDSKFELVIGNNLKNNVKTDIFSRKLFDIINTGW